GRGVLRGRCLGHNGPISPKNPGASMTSKSPPPKRRNRTVQLGDVIDGMLDPALRRRGFANRELLTNWSSIVPTPWGSATMPDKLVWPRKDRPDPDGAV